MIAMSFSYLMRFCMKSFGISTVATYLCYSFSKIHVSRTDLVVTFGDLESSLDAKYFELFPPATILPFGVPSLFSLRKIWDSRMVLLCYSVNSFLCIGMNVSLMWSCFIYECTDPLPFLPHFLMPALRKS